MLSKKIFFGCIISVCFSLLCVNCLFAGFPNLKLPFSGGETWKTSCAYDGTGGTDCPQTHVGADRYALDFNYYKENSTSGDDDCGKSTVAVAYGTVVASFDSSATGYGNRVQIDHGDGYFSFYAHLESRSVEVGDVVTQGQEIGKVGHSGTSSCHLHFAFYKVVGGVKTACKPEPMSNYKDFVTGVSYPSDNYDGTVTNFSVCSSTVYLASNGKFWPILNEKVYSLLGYGTSACSLTPDWSHIISAPDLEKSKYTIRNEVIPSENNAATGRMIAYRIVPKVGPISCMCVDVDPRRIYLFEGGKFCHIANGDVYKALGYKMDFSDVVNITPEMFVYYGSGQEVAGFSFNYTSEFLSDSYVSVAGDYNSFVSNDGNLIAYNDSGSSSSNNGSNNGNTPSSAYSTLTSSPPTVQHEPVTFVVPDEYVTIQEAIGVASDNDTVIVNDGTYFENVNFRGKAIELRSKKCRYLTNSIFLARVKVKSIELIK